VAANQHHLDSFCSCCGGCSCCTVSRVAVPV